MNKSLTINNHDICWLKRIESIKKYKEIEMNLSSKSLATSLSPLGRFNVGSSGRLDRGSFAKALGRVFASLQPVVPQPDATWTLDDDWPTPNVGMARKAIIIDIYIYDNII